jgi:ribonucleoside-diphosphate reductase alpha chain
MAMAPEQTGIGIRRHFTTVGVEPYEEVAWERRDARITNYRDGTVAFEQRDVEFPIGWSQNATNIVAQKYFRGSLGSPEREWSLRQVVDRVVDTVTRWGAKDGYFVDDEEAEAFRAELKHLVVHQKAAFNSQVWFNIGVKGEPQQASACFILAVDDTMRSILNWYVEEGTIFKGGSGSGINLSNIRSSHEPLKGGGTASGPVSFMRGADASAGTIKSGGKTRRAAKMVILNADHPDIEDFIWCKSIEERKARVLRDAGFDMDLDGKDSHSTQYQNANNSVRVTDEFMQAVVDDAEWQLKAVTTGEPVRVMKARDLYRQICQAAWECADPGMQFDTTINRWHTAANTGRINASNPCSEYMHLDNSACNLASLNLLRFLGDDGTFDVEGFTAAVSVVFTAQEILVGNADYPTESIAETSRRFRQLGLGYANLGAMLMALGMPYDSDAGRAWAGAITALMTGQAYATSARTASRMGPFAGYAENQEPMTRVLRMHRDEVEKIDENLVQVDLLSSARQSWDTAVELAGQFGVRNSQATVLAPTGCLVGGSLVATDRGLVRLGSLGDPDGPQWQHLEATVATPEGPRAATRFYVNGLEPVVTVETGRGHRIAGTAQHRVKVVDPATGAWEWRRFGDLTPGDLVPLALDQLVGEPRVATLPALAQPTAGDDQAHVPTEMTAELAELVGHAVGAGAADAAGIRFTAARAEFEVVERLERLGKTAFGVPAGVALRPGAIVEVGFESARLAAWWEACGFGADGVPHLVLATNDRWVYAAFLRGLFEGAGTVVDGCPQVVLEAALALDVQSLLLALGYPATRSGGTISLLDAMSTGRWLEEVGFVSGRKQAAVLVGHDRQSGTDDFVPVPAALVERLLPARGRLRQAVLAEAPNGGLSRSVAARLWSRTADAELGRLLSFSYDAVTTAELGAEELTYDLSVPQNVTYVANGFVSHNTIGLMMDCDTTGIEPDLGLCKTKKLVGGGTMSIVNQTVPRALRRLGYSAGQVDEIVAYIDEHKSIVGAPHLAADHLAVFACSMGDNTIHYLGHVKMMAAAQPWISGAISKCVVGDTLISTADGLVRIDSLHRGEAPDTFRDHVVEVASLEGTQKTASFYYGGTRRVQKAVLRSGHRITATPNHRLLVAADGRLEWRRMDELEVGDHVAQHYGAELWSVLPARFDDFRPTAPYGSQKPVRIPSEMTDELAFLLGAYASEGHTTRSTWTIVTTNSVEGVLERVAAAWRSEFGVEARIVRPVGRCAAVVVASKTIVEFLEYLGCGARASTKRIPDSVLRSPRQMVLSFLQGLSLDAYVSVTSMPKWAICLDSPSLLDDLQSVLTNLGVLHGRSSKYNRTYEKTYDEVYATGRHAQHLARLVPFMEPEKADRAAALDALVVNANRDTAGVVPGVSPYELYRLLPAGTRTPFAYLCDPRTRHVTRRSVERVAAVPGVVLPPWLRTVLDDGLHFSPVASVGVAGEREVFDLSVPATQAFVANGIVSHNTVNVPEDVTVDDVEQLHIDAWRMGLKAVAMYRDNCKVAQPLSTTKTAAAIAAGAAAGAAAASALVAPAERLVETVVINEPVRNKLPRVRRSKTMSFRVADCHGYVTVGEYDDGRPGEIFLKVAKQGSTLAGIMDAFAISVSHGLQYGVPLKAFVDMYTNMRFEPAGMTDDPDIRFASSLVDYIFRRLAVEYLPFEDRAELGILTVGERMQPTLPGVEEHAIPSTTGSEVFPDPAPTPPVAAPAPAPAVQVATPQPVASDAPYCYQCGMVMQRAGACFVCSSCGTTSGCS